MVDKVSMTVILSAMRRDMKYVDDDDVDRSNESEGKNEGD
jgi:hypothetical protein